jgi:branched-chain amino acid transport system ATP-binding protein
VSEDRLVVDGLQAGYGRVRVVQDVSFEARPAETVAIVGRNGAGKTTSLSALAGLRYGMSGGKVTLAGKDISKASPLQAVKAGLSLVAEGRRIFRDMSVTENLRLGAFTRRRRDRAAIASDMNSVRELFPALSLYKDKLVGELSGGQQQMVAVGQALMSKPRFLLLDEPTSGLAPALVDEMYDSFKRLVDGGIGIVVVDQSIERVLDWSDRYYVIDDGQVMLSGVSRPEAIEEINAIVLAAARN